MEPLNTLPKYNLFGLDDVDYSKAKVVVLPVPYDSTASYQSGARNGPHAIINASRNLELYSYEIGADISKIGVYTTDELAPDMSSPENMVERVKKEVALILNEKKIPMLLGGEHTITIGALKAFKEIGKEMSIVQLDAHTDSRDNLFGSKYMHATVMARAAEMFDDIVHIGIRSIDEEYARKASRDRLFFADMLHESLDNSIEAINDLTKESIYLTIDLDVLDPSIMPSVGTPEPNGLSFRETIKIIKALSEKKELAGLDIVELSPIPGLEAPNYTAAKLAYLTLGFFFSKELADPF
ncbi:MAG: agmatinase [Candidatus Micrarchaeia archaeon]|jgi:agmatinase